MVQREPKADRMLLRYEVGNRPSEQLKRLAEVEMTISAVSIGMVKPVYSEPMQVI